eukprot:4587012-Prymnesium_polylepis.1
MRRSPHHARRCWPGRLQVSGRGLCRAARAGRRAVFNRSQAGRLLTRGGSEIPHTRKPQATQSVREART